LVLAVAGLGNLVLTLDGGVMGVSYPALADAFNTSTSTILWVSVAFWVTGVGLVMTVGWLGDVGGRRMSYTLGFLLFSLALGLSAITTELWQLIATRVFMGFGSAMILAGVNAIILDRFDARERAKAIGIVGAVVGLGLSLGPLMGGWLLDVLGWQSLFYTRIPLSLVAAGLSWWVLAGQDKQTSKDFTVDRLGAVALFAVLASFLLIVNRGAENGFGSPLVLAMAVLFVIAVPVLVASQRRSARPILDFALFRRPAYSFGLGILIFHYTSLGAILLLAPFFFVEALGFSATKMGLFIMLYTLMRVFLAPLSGALTERFGAWVLSSFGLAAMVGSLAWLAALAGGSGSEGAILGALLLAGVGSGLYEPPNTATIMGSVPPDRYGTASASIASGRQLSFAVGVAIAGAIFAVRERAYLAAGDAVDRVIAFGFSDALLAGVALAGLGIAVSIIAITVTRRRG
jgi:EmrB/QacA subfamily drug resistance transporter